MISETIPTPVYNFLRYCNASPLEKKVLDCGAGGPNPPLWLFYEFGYRTSGVELSTTQIERSIAFCHEHGIDLGIIQGDMKDIPFRDSSFSFLFSHNTSVHMQKNDFRKALSEFGRVLCPGGMCYVNFLSTHCDTYGDGINIGDGEFLHKDKEGEVLFCNYALGEPERYMNDFEIVYKEVRTVERFSGDSVTRSSYYDYIMRRHEVL